MARQERRQVTAGIQDRRGARRGLAAVVLALIILTPTSHPSDVGVFMSPVRDAHGDPLRRWMTADEYAAWYDGELARSDARGWRWRPATPPSFREAILSNDLSGVPRKYRPMLERYIQLLARREGP